jgi:drug/metabolite transporter (DMT)-like permease
MTTALEQPAASRVAPIGLLFLVTASVGWGLNWPVMRFVFSEWPPLSARGWAGVIGAAALALYAVATGVSLKVPADQWPRLSGKTKTIPPLTEAASCNLKTNWSIYQQ